MTRNLSDDIRKLVYQRANGCCEYCLTCEINTGQTMQIDHIIPSAGDDVENLALSCWNCNNHKRQAIKAVDPNTNQIVKLFHPRYQIWSENFIWIDNSIRVMGLTSTGRATIVRLKLNRPAIIIARQRWVDAGYHPPS